MNATLLSEEPHREEVVKGLFGSLPNGMFKTTIAASDDIDEKIVEVSYFSESSFHINRYSNAGIDFK